MSTLKVNSVVNRTDTGGPTFLSGAKVPSGQIFKVEGGVTAAGVVTATSFIGNGAELSNLAVVTAGKTVAYKLILRFDEYGV